MNLETAIRTATAPFTRRLVRTRLGTVEGLEHLPDGPCVLAPNHSSYFDHFVMGMLMELRTGRPVWFLTKRESFEKPLQRAWARAWYGIPVDRDAPGPDTIREVRRVLADGDVLCVYPEGTRNPSDELLPFKAGAFRFALANDVPLIPVAMHGTRDVHRKGEGWFRSGRVDVVVGPALPVDATMTKKEASERLSTDTRAAITTLVDRARANSADADREHLAREHAVLLDRLITGALDEHGVLAARDGRRLTRLVRMLRGIDRTPVPTDVLAQVVRLEGLRLSRLPAPLRAVAAIAYRRSVQRILDADPRHPVGNYLMGRWHLSAPAVLGGDRLTAVDHFQASAVTSEPGDTRADVGLAEALIAVGERTSAAAALRQVISDTPSDHPRHAVRVAKARRLLAELEDDAVVAARG